MRLEMRTRRAMTKEVARRYRKAPKAAKGRILDNCATTGYNRSYAARVLRKRKSGAGDRGKKPPGARGQGRKPVYTAAVTGPLVKIWAILNFPCGKRLVSNLQETVRVLERFGEITLSPEVKEKLLRMSAATADRLLARTHLWLSLISPASIAYLLSAGGPRISSHGFKVPLAEDRRALHMLTS